MSRSAEPGPRPPVHTLDQLVVLEAIVQAGSFAGAARALHRVPSAITYTVKALETALGVQLFERSQARARLTSQGRRILEAGQDVLAPARRLDRLALIMGAGVEPSLSVVVDGVYPTAPLMRAVRQFTGLGWPTQLRIHVEYQSGVVARFEQDAADLMLMLEFDGTGAWSAIPLPEIEMVLVVAREHPLAAARSVDREALRAHVELVVRDSGPAFVEAPRAAWFGGHHVVRLSDFHSKLIALRAGAGHGWLPVWLAAPQLASGELVEVDFEGGARWTYHPHLVHRRDLPLGRAGTAFLEALQEAALAFNIPEGGGQ